MYYPLVKQNSTARGVFHYIVTHKSSFQNGLAIKRPCRFQNELLCYACVRRFEMNVEDRKATVHLAGKDLFVGITPSQHSLTLDTNALRPTAEIVSSFQIIEE